MIYTLSLCASKINEFSANSLPIIPSIRLILASNKSSAVVLRKIFLSFVLALGIGGVSVAQTAQTLPSNEYDAAL